MDGKNTKGIIFANYDSFIKRASEFNLSRMGMYAEDLANEAIIGTLDCEKIFKDEKSVVDFVNIAIKNIYYSEIENSKKFGGEYLQEETNSGNLVHLNMGLPAKIDEMYDLFFDIRFPKGLKCSKCGSDKISVHRGDQYCLLCNKYISITNETSLKSTKLSFTQIYKMAKAISCMGWVNYKIIAAEAGIKNISGLFKGRSQLMKYVMLSTKSRDVVAIVKGILAEESKPKHISERKIFNPGGSLCSLNNTLTKINNLEYKIYEQSKRTQTSNT